jgi:hypothetical protein
MNKKRVGILMMCALLMAAMLMGCTSKDGEGHTNTGDLLPSGSVTPNRPETDTYVLVTTQYGELYYQEQWEAYMKVEQVQNQNVLQVRFKTEINGNEYALFTLEIGGGSGAKIGQLTDSRGTKRDVNVTVHPIAEDLPLTTEEANRVYAMQEEINYIIQYLQ